MKIPYLTDLITRKFARRLGNINRGVKITKFGFILFELPLTPAVLRLYRSKNK